MDALELVASHMDATKIIEHYRFEGVKIGGKYTRACCKVHGSDNDTSFVINNENGLWTCHTNCGSGSIYKLVQQLEDITFKEALYKVAEILGVSLEGVELDTQSEEYLRESKKWIQIIKSNQRKSEIEDYTLPVPTRNVKKYRKFQEETLRHFGLSFIESIELQSDKGGTYTLQNRIALPINFKQRCIGYALRKTREADFPKWSNQPKGLPTKEILYNYDTLHYPSNVVLCEGFFDVWAFHEIGVNAVSTFGAHLTDEQYKLLMRTGCTSVTIAFDGDRAGREATEKVIQKLKGKVDVYVVKFDEGTDAESISRMQLREYWEGKTRKA